MEYNHTFSKIMSTTMKKRLTMIYENIVTQQMDIYIVP